MTNSLVVPDDLNDFPGAPFPGSVVDAAVNAIREEAGWHIAPVVTETVTIDAQGGVLVMLPTMRLVSVAEIRDVSDPLLPVVLDEWRVSRAGMVYREKGWPLGFGTVEVDMVHGFAQTPADLLTVVAERCQWAAVNATVSQQSSGPFSVSLRSASEANSSPTLARYKLPPRQ